MEINKGVQKIIENSLKKDPSELNIDWFGTMLISGLLNWYDLGYPQVKDFSEKWWNYHLKRQPSLSDEEFHLENGGLLSRLYRDYTIPFSTYAGYFGLSFACNKIYDLTNNEKAKQMCIDVADCILHRCARNSLGLVMHDDGDSPFTIPDVSYFVSPPLFYASKLDENQGVAFNRQAVFQLMEFIKVFLDDEKNIAKTIHKDGKTGETYWIRASGWLIWNMVESMEFIDNESNGSNEFKKLRQYLNLFIQGLTNYQDNSGGFHLLIDESDTPLETTGTAMITYAIHKAVRKGWCDEKYLDVSLKAWEYVTSKIDDEGELTGCYSGWAVPAEARELDFDRPMNWMPGMILIAASELLLTV